MAEQKRDYYEVLGVDKNADDAALKKAYRAPVSYTHLDVYKRQFLVEVDNLSLTEEQHEQVKNLFYRCV